MDIQKNQVALLQGQLQAAAQELNRQQSLMLGLQAQLATITNMLIASILQVGENPAEGEYRLGIDSQVVNEVLLRDKNFCLEPIQVEGYDGTILRVLTEDSDSAEALGLTPRQQDRAGVDLVSTPTVLLGANGRPVKQ